ncbi:FxsB family radical SAM/SPASM domain protein [Streptomyces sp. NBC_00124]|uniref:FxsB family cyclophane-forming radical SAM/SPASM peptide maturase n=1 Tax=Streptomyces sp. NBC_00124 TaxID=2975662 RepID=UPI0022530371|nr:FxsB family cyclophane-forming radical SAM/SPASM peptide maturase [Streptomyces sp. NBC_00124]MCX5360043.1 FxsB family radical SAM/SPASM domain protein [Streptomyces sp. NBC_00124]
MWPLETLDVPDIRRSGVQAVPFRQFVLKTHSLCNLACSYCYVYEGADDSWRDRPRCVSPKVIRRTAARIAEHSATHGLDSLQVNLHGGEPLLAGVDTLVDYVAEVREAVGPGCAVEASVQTNGTLLTEDTVGRLAAAGVRIGVSLDGGTPWLNRHRLGHTRRSTWAATAAGLEVLHRHPRAYAGILSVIDPCTDPVEVYTSLTALEPPSMDLLLPHANWAHPPAAEGPHPYGDWLATVFDLWFDANTMAVPVRLFHEIIGLLLGVPGWAEAVGNSPVVAVVVDTDGTIEQVDSLKTAYAGAPATGCDVFRHSFDDVLDHPGIVARQLGLEGLAPQCRVCPLVEVCGGGNYAHRYRAGEGFLNPSVYCPDLEFLIRHIADRVHRVAHLTNAGEPINNH